MRDQRVAGLCDLAEQPFTTHLQAQPLAPACRVLIFKVLNDPKAMNAQRLRLYWAEQIVETCGHPALRLVWCFIIISTGTRGPRHSWQACVGASAAARAVENEALKDKGA